MSAILLQGGAGTGKTFVLRTVLEVPNTHLFLIMTDAGGEDGLVASLNPEQRSRLHVARIPTAKLSFAEFGKISEIINSNTYEAQAGMKSGIETSRFRQLMAVSSQLFDWKENGKSYGSVVDFPKHWPVAIDNLSGLSRMTIGLMVGARSVVQQGEYKVCQDHLENLIDNCIGHIPTFIALAHIERELNPITGQYFITTSAIGQKLGPKIPPKFGDVIHTYRTLGADGKPTFLWDNINPQCDLKSRVLPLRKDLTPDLRPWLAATSAMPPPGAPPPQPKEI